MENIKIKYIFKSLMVVILSLIIVLPASANDIDLEKEVNLKIIFRHKSNALEGDIKMYHVADIEMGDELDVTYKVRDNYNKIVSEIKDFSGDAFKLYADEFAKYNTDKSLVYEGSIGENGLAVIKGMNQGLYLVVAENIKGYVLKPFLISLPMPVDEKKDASYVWIYDVESTPKISLKNEELESERLDPPKTGDNINKEKYIVIFLCGAVLLASIRRRDV